jgi:hypothetical protein
MKFDAVGLPVTRFDTLVGLACVDQTARTPRLAVGEQALVGR